MQKKRANNCFRTEEGMIGRLFGTDAEKVPRLESALAERGEMSTEKELPKLCLSSEETKLQLVSK